MLCFFKTVLTNLAKVLNPDIFFAVAWLSSRYSSFLAPSRSILASHEATLLVSRASLWLIFLPTSNKMLLETPCQIGEQSLIKLDHYVAVFLFANLISVLV